MKTQAQKDYYKQWREAHPEKVQEYIEKGKQKRKEQQEKGYSTSIYDPSYYQSHKKEMNRNHAKWLEKNKEHIREYQREYFQKNKRTFSDEQIEQRRNKQRTLEAKQRAHEYYLSIRNTPIHKEYIRRKLEKLRLKNAEKSEEKKRLKELQLKELTKEKIEKHKQQIAELEKWLDDKNRNIE